MTNDKPGDYPRARPSLAVVRESLTRLGSRVAGFELLVAQLTRIANAQALNTRTGDGLS